METDDRPLPSFLGMIVFVLAACAQVVAIHAAMMPYRTGGGMFLGWLFCLLALAVTGGLLAKIKLGSSGAFFLPFLLFAVFSCVYGIVGGQLPRLLVLRETPLLSAADAALPAHESSHVFHLSDGLVLRKYHSTQRVSRKMSAAGRYHVAPIVPRGWKESDPVPAWAVGEGPGEFPSDAWRQDVGGGYRCIADATYREMIAGGRLTSKPGAPLLFLTEHPREALLADARFELWCLLGVAGLSLASGVLLFIRRGRN
jgi:hypothetical protein